MGNKISRRRTVVDERCTRPQGLEEHKEGDYRKLRRLILNGQLAPCFPGAEECAFDLDECPICFLFYPSLNRSGCCAKAICTECYLQIKSSDFGRSARCPFCKTSSYMVEYHGAKTLEEKDFEQAEEQKVIEAKIRIRQEELRGDEERMLRVGEHIQAGRASLLLIALGETLHCLDVVSAREQGLHLLNTPNSDIYHHQIRQREDPFEHETNQMFVEPGLGGERGMSARREYVQGSFHGSKRYDGFDLDMEDIMYREAIWLSIQEQGQTYEEFAIAQQIPAWNALGEAELRKMAGGRRLVTGGLAEAIAALAEREAITVENGMGSQAVSRNHTDTTSLRYRDLGAWSSSQSVRSADMAMGVGNQEAIWENGLTGELKQSYSSEELNGWIDVSQKREGRDSFDWMLDQSSEAAEVGTSFSFNVPSASDRAWESPDLDPTQSSDRSCTSASMMPESFEEQIMLAMALSLAEEARRHLNDPQKQI